MDTGVKRKQGEYVKEDDRGKQLNQWLRKWGPFVSVFGLSAFLMKIPTEIAHELLGHGSFVLLFGGQIRSIQISLLWPYILSGIHWQLPSSILPAQMVWIQAGGILVCGLIAYAIQILLLWKKGPWYFSVPLFWLSFWCFMNAVGYLVIGGLFPFGDIAQLIGLGVLTSTSSLILGLVLLFLGFGFLSTILHRILLPILDQRTKWAVLAFWFLIPVLVSLALAGLEISFPPAIPLSFAPVLLSLLLEFYLREKFPSQLGSH